MKIIVTGCARGEITRAQNPINFLGAVEKETGRIRDEGHDLFGKTLSGSILAFPYGIGSSVGAYTIYALKSNDAAPAAMICQKADLMVASGCAMANIPLLVADENEFKSLRDGLTVSVDTKSSPFVTFE